MLALNLTGVFGVFSYMAVNSRDAVENFALNGGMVLIVENDERISRLERFVPEQVGYRVTCAGTGKKPWRYCPTPLRRWSS
jgi:hypothetical protein